MLLSGLASRPCLSACAQATRDSALWQADDFTESLASCATTSHAAFTTLTDLRLYSNHVGERGALALATALTAGAMPALTRLELQGNPFAAAGLIAADVIRSACESRAQAQGSKWRLVI
jgi:hypothetical protein